MCYCHKRVRPTHVLQGTDQLDWMTDAERVLAVLIHDVRTPLGVAQGYLRLVRTDKLPSPEERDRALASTQEALARVARLCQEAGGFLDDASAPDGRPIAAADLAERVAAALAERGIAAADRGTIRGTVSIGASVDRAAEAIVTLLAVRGGGKQGAIASVVAVPGAIRFACGAPVGDGTGGPALDGAERSFDPWNGAYGLGVALANRRIGAMGGRVWIAGDGLALALSLPMETGNA